MTNALHRRDEILRLVRQQPVHSQDELLELLRGKGFAVTQPTLSRDLRELGLVKTPAGYSDPSALSNAGALLDFVPPGVRELRLEAAVREHVLSATIAGTLVILKTPPAGAQPVALVVDAAQIAGVVGTLGGDDTVFVAAESVRAARALTRRIHDLIGAAPVRRRRA